MQPHPTLLLTSLVLAAVSGPLEVTGFAPDTDPPRACPTLPVITCEAGRMDNFTGPEPASPGSNLLARLEDLELRGFDEDGTDEWFAHSFGALPPNVTAARLRLSLRAGAGFPAGDTIELSFAQPGGTLRPERWNARLGTAGNVAGLLPSPWSTGTEHVLTLDLSRLPNADGSFTDLLPTLRSEQSLDVIVQDDTLVDYLVLEVEICQCQPDITVNANPGGSDAVVNFPTPVFLDEVDPNLAVQCQPPSGSLFPAGTTTVVCSATDNSGNVGRCAFRVIVSATRPAVRFSLGGNRLILEWPEETSKLQQSDSIAGGWTDVEPPPASPYPAPMNRPAQFFRAVPR